MTALIWLTLAGSLVAENPPPTTMEIAPGKIVRFATAEEGKPILMADDAFTKSLSRFDLQSRLKTGDEVTRDDWKKSVAAEVRDWNDAQTKATTESLARLSKRLARFELPLPKEIVLIHTTGAEEGNAAYTRGTAIILPDKVLAYSPTQLDRLLAHELFHILSRHDAPGGSGSIGSSASRSAIRSSCRRVWPRGGSQIPTRRSSTARSSSKLPMARPSSALPCSMPA